MRLLYRGRVWRSLLILLLISGSGCGRYSFSGSMSPDIKSIAIPVFEDRSAEFEIREKLTSALVDKFLSDNNLRVLDSDVSDSILSGTIHRVEDRPVAISQNEQAQAFELSIYINITYENRNTNTVIFEKNLRGRGTFSGPEDRELGIEEAIENLSADVLNMVISHW
jgi:hypothetical protein